MLWLGPASAGNGGPATASSTQPAAEREAPPVAASGPTAQRPVVQLPAREGVIQEMLPRTGPAPESEPLRLFDKQRFEGLGTLRIRASTRPGVPFPEHWTLVLAPSEVLIGGQYAQHRRVEVTGGVRELVLDDVPLGGYEVRAEAPRMNCMRKLILLAQPDEQDRPVFLELTPAGFLTGRVVDSEGRPIDGVPLVLEPLGSGTRRTQATDAAGTYVFEDVPDAEYRLYAGVPESPLAPARELAFRAPRLTMPDLELPVLGELEILVLELGDIPAAGIQVTGWGKQGGRIDVTTDDRGEARVRFLPPGWFTLLAQHGDGGRTRARVELDSGQLSQVVIVLER